MMTYSLYALTVVAVGVGVIIIYSAALIVISGEVLITKEKREAEARKLTYYLTLAIAVFAFGVFIS